MATDDNKTATDPVEIKSPVATPVDESKATLVEAKTPVDESKATLVEAKTPVDERKPIIVEAKIPANDSKTSTEETKKPVDAPKMSINDTLLRQKLLENGLIQEKSLLAIEKKAAQEKVTLSEIIFKQEIIPDDKLGAVMAEIYAVPYVKLAEKTIAEPLLRMVPHTLAASQHVIPFQHTGSSLKVAMNNPCNWELISSLGKKTGLEIEPYYATKKDIKLSLKAYNKDVNEKFNKLLKGVLADPTKIESLKDSAKIVDTIILFAFQNNASDIHIEPRQDTIIVRYRIDGLLQQITELPISILDLLTTRIKVLANLRTDEHKSAQDGRFKIELENNEITLRVSILPTYDGEKTVLRLLTSTNQALDLESLGYSGQNLNAIRRNILKTHGIILMTGPTGSGKTTTLYSILKLLNSPEVNISTIEDPIEYRLEGINQIQVNPKSNLTFAMGLRSLLRQDPDIVMVGEIRDEETAGIAINAALTGHLVLATLHTNDASSTLPRMLEMGVEAFLLGATIQLVVAQRLVRMICPKCKKEHKITAEEIKGLGNKYNIKKDFTKIIERITNQPITDASIFTFYKGEGCDACVNSGYKGRTSICEVIEVSNDIKQILLRNGNANDIDDQAQKEGMVTMFVDGIQKVLKGDTTIDEVLRVMRS
ncbi:MAG: GspE/PulE family protein [Candidatus Gracilibacteria bacterium]|jgi:type IV pilus assembly protein PilB